MPPGNKPLPEPMFTYMCAALWRHNESKYLSQSWLQPNCDTVSQYIFQCHSSQLLQWCHMSIMVYSPINEGFLFNRLFRIPTKPNQNSASLAACAENPLVIITKSQRCKIVLCLHVIMPTEVWHIRSPYIFVNDLWLVFIVWRNERSLSCYSFESPMFTGSSLGN